MNILIPMTGDNRFNSSDYFYPKPLVEINGTPMVELAIDQFRSLEKACLIPVISKSDALDFSLNFALEQICSDRKFSIIEIAGETAGSLCTCLLALGHIPDDSEILIINYDQHLRFDPEVAIDFFRQGKCDFGVVCFDSTHPKWSYVELDANDNVMQAAEKKPISKNALAGFYYFKDKRSFFQSAERCILEAPLNKKVFFVSDTLNHCILSGQNGKAFRIKVDQFIKFSSPSDIRLFSEHLHSSSKL